MFLFYLYFAYKSLLANSVERDQTPGSAASDLGGHCLQNARKRVFGLKRVNFQYISEAFPTRCYKACFIQKYEETITQLLSDSPLI